MRGSASCCLWRCWCSGRCGCAVRPGCWLFPWAAAHPDPPAPSTPAALALLGCRLECRLEARPCPPDPPAPSTPAALALLGVSSRSPARPLRRSRAPQLGRRGYCASSTFACNSSVTISVFELVSLELQRFWVLLKVHAIELHAESLVCVSVVTHGHCSRSLLEARPVPPVPPAAAHTDRLLLSG